MQGQASLELLLVVAAAIAMLAFVMSSVSSTYEAGREVAALRAAQSLLASVDHACQRADASGAPQRVESTASVKVMVTKEPGLLVARFSIKGKQLRVSRATSWCEGSWLVEPGATIIFQPRQPGE